MLYEGKRPDAFPQRYSYRCKNQINIFNVPEAESLRKTQEIQWMPFWQRGVVKEGKESTMHTNSFASDSSKRHGKRIFNPKLIFFDKKDQHYEKKSLLGPDVLHPRLLRDFN